jgi:hypothetical protein
MLCTVYELVICESFFKVLKPRIVTDISNFKILSARREERML